MKKDFILLVFLLAVITGCSTGKKALEKGDYDKAVIQAVKRLRNDTDNEKAIATLKKAYKLSAETHQRNANKHINSSDRYKWERMVYEYKAIDDLNNEIQHCPACMKIIPKLTVVTEPLKNASKKAAEIRYSLATKAMKQKQNRQKAIEAHKHLLKMNELDNSYADVEEMMNEALFYATLKVVVEPIPAPNRMLQINQDFFNNKVNEYLHRNKINDYVRFYTPLEVRTAKLEFVDHKIVMEFDRFILGNVISNTTERLVSRDSVKVGTQEGEPVYGTVKATLRIHNKAIVGSGLLNFEVRDMNINKVLTQEKFPSEYRWGITWATYNGDDRALTREELEMVNTREQPIPNPQFMFEEFTAPLFDQAINKIRNYYRNI